MIAWVLYDIENDKARTKVAKICKQAGLYRVQFSVFLGTLDKSRKDTLQLQIEELIDEESD
jgi:CRISPR-associated protein Cas2